MDSSPVSSVVAVILVGFESVDSDGSRAVNFSSCRALSAVTVEIVDSKGLPAAASACRFVIHNFEVTLE